MALFDYPLDQLRVYTPVREEPADFDAFWQTTLAESRRFDLDPHFERVDFGLKTLESYDVTFNGFGGQPIKGWFLKPYGQGKLPAVCQFVGYGGGRGFPTDWLLWPSAGYAFFVMDTRGQGSEWMRGDTPDIHSEGSDPHIPGFTTLGIASPTTYYYRRLFVDAVRAVEAVRTNPHVNAEKIALTGGSQGGAITLAAAGLDPDISVFMPDVPYCCHFRRAVEITDAQPYREISKYCQTHRDKIEQVFETLSYFDGVNLAARTRGRALFSVGLMDEVCPPSTVFAAYNHVPGPKEIKIYPFNHHEGGGPYQDLEKIKFLAKIWQQ